MRFATFRLITEGNEAERVGVVKDDEIFETTPSSSIQQIIASAKGTWAVSLGAESHAMDSVVLCAPVRRPGKIVAAIVNTQGMLGGDATIDRPRLDMKAPSTVIGPGEPIVSASSGIRPEVELAVVIGRTVSRASRKQSADSVFGYTVLNDVTAPKDSKDDAYEAYRRDPRTKDIHKTIMRGPLFRSKNHDTFCPMGPWIVTSDELPDVGNLKMSTVFGDLRVQDGSTSEYIFSPVDLVSYVSGFLTLEPGDIVSCGSVGWSKEVLGGLDPTEFVLPSERGLLRLEVEGIGALENPVTLPSAGES